MAAAAASAVAVGEDLLGFLMAAAAASAVAVGRICWLF